MILDDSEISTAPDPLDLDEAMRIVREEQKAKRERDRNN